MKELELLTILTNVRGEYILQAQELRSGNQKQLRLMHRKRTFLIAAVVSLLLLLVGCAAVLIGMQKVSLGHMEFSDLLWQEGQPFERDVLSLNGYVDSPGYRATQEWLAFENSYDKDRTLLQNADSDDYELPQDYYAYLCYTQEMQDKIDEICGKYGLELAGPLYFADHTEEVLTAVMVPSIANVDSHSDLALEGGRYYRSGSFLLNGTLQHRFEDRQNVDTVMFSYSCDKKNVFFPGYITTEDMDTFDVWEYTAWDGAQLLLAQNKERGLILADTGDCFTSIVLYFSLGEVIEVDNPGLRTDMEEIADAFAYNIQPKAPGLQWLDNPNGLYSWESSRTYDEYFSHWMSGSVGSEAYSPDYQQKFVDLDEDGTDEMLIWNIRTGVVYEVVTRVDGELQCIYSGDIFLTEDSTRMYLCQGNTLEKALHGELYGRQWNEYHRMEDQQLMPVEVVMEGNDGKFYWSESGGASSLMWKEISESEYNAVRSKYVRIPGTLEEQSELSNEAKSRLKNEAESRLLQVMMDQYAFYRPDDGMEYYLTDYCRRTGDQLGFPVSITRYAFVDMDGDGTAEAVVDFKFGENEQVMCMVLKYDSGTVFGAEFYHRQMSHIKKDGSFAYSGGGDNDGWAKLRWENNTWVEEPAPDATNKEDVTWVSYPITADVHSDAAFSLFREVFMPMSEGAAKPTMESLRTLAGEAGYYVDVHYEFDFLILMPGSKVSGTQKDGLLTDMVYTLYLPPLEGNAELYTLEVGVENLNTDSPQFCIYRPHTNPIAANSASDLAEYINWHRIHPRDSYTNWNPSMIIYECK